MELEEKIKEYDRQLEAAWTNIDELKTKVISIETLAKHADRGYIEIYSELKNLKNDFNHVEIAHTELITLTKENMASFENFKDDIGNKLNKNLLWTLGFIVSLLTLYGAILLSIFLNAN